jgi:hypothetical protein
MASDPPHPPDAGFAPAPRGSTAQIPPTVAVIAIHGVGQHPPGASAQALADLLASVGRRDANADPLSPGINYSSFAIQSIEVPLSAVATEYTPTATQKSKTGRRLSLANDRHQTTLWQKIFGAFDERRGFLAEKSDASRVVGGSAKTAAAHLVRPPHESRDFSYLFMLEQLADYEGEPGRNFSTFRYDSRPGTTQPDHAYLAPDVHIYDAHYSDLSKPENSFVGFFFAFYQLLFHLAGIGLQGVYLAEKENTAQKEPNAGKGNTVGGRNGDEKENTAKKENQDNGASVLPWRMFSGLHATAVRMLTMFIPILNLVLLAIGVSAFADKLNSKTAAAVGYGLAALIGLTATLLVRNYYPSPPRPILWAAIPFVGAGLVTAILAALAWAGHAYLSSMWSARWLVVITWLVLAGIAIFFIARRFGEVRRGADWVAPVIYVGNVLVFLFWFLPRASTASDHQAATAAFLTIQLIFGELAVCWVGCLAAEFLSWPVSQYCVTRPADADAQCRARAAHRTARFSFAISASAFLITTLILWSGVASYTSNKLHVFDDVRQSDIDKASFAHGWVAYVIPNVDDLQTRMRCLQKARGIPCPAADQILQPTDALHPWNDYLDGLLLIAVTPGLPFTLALIALSLLLLVWAATPSVLFEIWPKRTPPSEHKSTVGAGDWLSRGLDNVAILIRVLWLAIVPVPLFFGALNLLSWHGLCPHIFQGLIDNASRWTLPLILGGGAVVAVSAAAIIGLILKYGVVILDTLLDVDNYLRTVPVGQTPRARIAERITSLLRHVAAHRDAQGRPYQRLVIVAHSLGTLVAADLLRFLTISTVKHPDPPLRSDGLRSDLHAPAVPVYLLTMGSPLRPLLNRFFPHLYEWVTPKPDNSSAMVELAAALSDPPAEIPPGTAPEPQELSVNGWCNTYRSGDYVGRFLWSGLWFRRNADSQGYGAVVHINDAAPARRAEMCIGIGAHTHYWDRTAPDVADALHALITNPAEIFPTQNKPSTK